MEIAKIVIGANFGDEGKGLMTDYFAHEAKSLHKSCLVVCHNGGSQKGHTVVSPSGVRHVFHHFGSGHFEGADTFLSSEYIVNPIIFRREFTELQKIGIPVKCFVHENCRITTPFDMMLNQIAEAERGADKHGSCGLGIFETILRTNYPRWGFTVSSLANTPLLGIRIILDDIASEYFPHRLKQLGIDRIPVEWVEILGNKGNLISNYIQDFLFFMNHIELVNDCILDNYQYVIFEGAQGLLLDQNNLSYMPHLTPSNTGIKNPMELIGHRNLSPEVCYVSRTYMTRHGAGRFDTECRKADINSKMVDLTNVPNPYQDALRYGTLDLDDLKDRIEVDSGAVKAKKSIAMTHCNEYEIDRTDLKKVFQDFCIYLSDGMTHDDIVRL